MWIRLLTVASMQAAKDTLCQDADSGRNTRGSHRTNTIQPMCNQKISFYNILDYSVS